MADYLTLADIRTAISRNAKQFTGKKDDMLDHLINMVYLSEVMSVDQLRPLFWLVSADFTRASVAPATITAITAANPGVFTAAAHGLATGDIAHFYGILGMTELNGLMGQITRLTADTFSAGIDTTNFTAYTSGGKAFHRGITLLSGSADKVLAAGWNGYKPPMRPLTPEDMESDTTFHNQDNTAGPPSHYIFGKTLGADGAETNQLIWSPASDNAYALRYVYTQPVTRLSADGHVPILPARFHDAIVAGVLARLAENKGEKVGIENASLWPVVYRAHLEAIKQYNQEYWTNVEEGKQVSHYML